MSDGYIRKAAGFTSVENTIARNHDLSFKAKGLYLTIQAYITIPDSKFKKSDFFKMCKEGDKAFESTWTELKEAGYLKTHIFTINGKFVNEYEILIEPKMGPHTFYYDKNGKLVKTNLDLKIQREKKQENERNKAENCAVNEISDCDEAGEEYRYPHKEDTDRIPQNGSNGNGTNGNGSNDEGIYAYGINAKGDNGTGDSAYIDNSKDFNILNSNTDNNTFNKNINNNTEYKTDYNKSLHPLTIITQEELIEEPDFKMEEEKVKKQIDFDKLIYRHQGNKKLLRFIVAQMTDMLCEMEEYTELSSKVFEKTSKVKKNLLDIRYDDIDELLNNLPAEEDKDYKGIANKWGYIRTCLYNIPKYRGAICHTQQIRGKKGAWEYDYDECFN
ncbi:MAG: hypothetical protein K5988_03915 [Lachnospiraceae bacterium]|nr:hypothetical protein [Lachnospiraceae bacterium]